MEWYWIILIILLFLCIADIILGYLLFLYMCKPDREHSASLDGNKGRALYPYVPVIKEYALKNTKFPHKIVTIDSFDGIKLRAKLYPNELTDHFVILVHGYHSSFSWDFGASFEMYYKEGYTVLALDDRGHGSEGKYIGFGVLDEKDVKCWMNWLIDQYGVQCKIAIIGVSMGAATAMLVTGNAEVSQLKCVVEDCGYSSLSGVIGEIMRKKNVPKQPLYGIASLWCKLLAGYSFKDADAEKAVSKSKIPTLFIHGTADGFVPFSMLDQVYGSCSAVKEKAVFEGAVHGESSYKDPERYRNIVISFLSRYMKD